MANGEDEPVTWKTFREHEWQTSKGFERLGILEEKVNNHGRELRDMRDEFRLIQKTVWQASGIIAFVVVITTLFLKFYH